jgi:hypothetical protein
MCFWTYKGTSKNILRIFNHTFPPQIYTNACFWGQKGIPGHIHVCAASLRESLSMLSTSTYAPESSRETLERNDIVRSSSCGKIHNARYLLNASFFPSTMIRNISAYAPFFLSATLPYFSSISAHCVTRCQGHLHHVGLYHLLHYSLRRVYRLLHHLFADPAPHVDEKP